MLIIEDTTVTEKCRTAIEGLLIYFSHTQFQLATLNINKEHKTVESSKLYHLIN
jgi:hypothetical protein